MTLIGFSWGTFPSLMIAAQHPGSIKKLILIRCPPFSDADAKSIMQVRKSRLKSTELELFSKLNNELVNASITDKKALYSQLGNPMDKADCFSMEPLEELIVEFQHDIFEKVVPEAANLRKQGYFIDLVSCVY